MAYDALETLIPGTQTVWIGDVGSILPAAGSDPTAAPNAAFSRVGFTTPAGVKFGYKPNVIGFKASQSRQDIRRIVNFADITAAFEAMQWNWLTLPFAFGGGVLDTSGSFWTYTFPGAGQALDERAMLIDIIDGDRHSRVILARGTVDGDVETTLTNDQTANFPISFKALEPTDGSPACYIVGDDLASFTAGS